MSLYVTGSMFVGVTLWFGWGGVVSVCGLKHIRFTFVSVLDTMFRASTESKDF